MFNICTCNSAEDNNVTNEIKSSSDEEIKVGSKNIPPFKSKDIRSSKSSKKIERDIERHKKPKDDRKEEESASDEIITNIHDSKKQERQENTKSVDKRKPRKRKSKGYRVLYKRRQLESNSMNDYFF